MSKTVLLRSPGFTKSGYGVHARQVARWLFRYAAKKHDLDITVEPLGWGATHWIVDTNAEDGLIGEMIQATQNQKPFYDVTIQLQLPNEWNPMLGDYNIGMTAGVETDKCNPEWVTAINAMSMVIVPSEFTKKTFLNTGEVTVPIVVVPEAFPDALLDEAKNIELNLPTKFNFLVFGQFTGNNIENDRKNLPYTLKWMAEAFAGDPNVGIILKTNLGSSTKLDKNQVLGLTNRLLSEVGANNVGPKFYLLHGDMTDAELKGLYTHPTVKAMVSFTRGEGFCGLGSTPIVTKNGLKRLDSMQVNDEVLTHKNNWKKVSKTLNRNYSGEMLEIVPFNSSLEKITLTPNHNVYVFDLNTKEYNWKPAGELTENDYLTYPLNKRTTTNRMLDLSHYINDTNLLIEEKTLNYKQSNNLGKVIPRFTEENKNFGRLIGYYMSEGCFNNGSIIFSLNKNEKDTLSKDIIQLMREVFKLETFHETLIEDTNKLLLAFRSKIVGQIFETICGKNARNKKLCDDQYANSSIEFINGYISGLLAGDGWISEKYQEISLELASIETVRQCKQLLINNNIFAAMNSQHRVGIIKKTVYDNEYYRIRVGNIESYNNLIKIINDNCPYANYELASTKHENKGTPKSFFDKNYLISKVKKIEKIDYEGIVYNLSVEDDESYCTENFMVHNCLPAVEAAACDLPVIATGWSAHTEFLGLGKYGKVDYFLDEIHESRVDNKIFMKGAKWAKVYENDAKYRLKKFYDKSDLPKEWAIDLGKKIREKYCFESIANLYSEVLDPVLK